MAVPKRFHCRAGALTSSLALCLSALPVSAEDQWHICEPFERRVTCIVDGDTLWFHGQKMRLRNIDTPEIDGKCHQERQLASRATQRLLVLVQSGVRTITRYGHDPYGRALVTVETNVGMAGDILLREGLADRFGDGIRANWCRS